MKPSARTCFWLLPAVLLGCGENGSDSKGSADLGRMIPSIASIVPSSGPTDGATVVVINGVNFAIDSTA